METHVNSYKLNQNNKEYILRIGLVGNSIRISCQNSLDPSSQSFTRDFTLEQLQQLDEIFNRISTPLEAVNYMDKALGIQKVGISESDNNLKVNFFITTQGMVHQLEIPLGQESASFSNYNDLAFGQQSTANEAGPFIGPVDDDNSQINTLNNYSTGDFNQINTIDTTGMNLGTELTGENANYAVGTDENAYGNYDSTNILQNIQYGTDTTTNQYTTGFTDINTQFGATEQYQNIETSNYTSQYGENLGTDLLSQYQTGTQDLTSQYATGDITNQYSTDLQNITNQYSGEATNIVDQYTSGTEQYSGDNQDYSSYFKDTTNNYIGSGDNQAQNYSEYNITNTTIETTNYIQPSESLEKPYISPADDINKNLESSNQYYKITTTTTKTTNVNPPNQSDDKIVQLEGATNSLKDEHLQIYDQLKALAGQVNSCRAQLSLAEKDNTNLELNTLRAENRAIKQQLLELNQLRNDAAEAKFLRNQLKELDPLRRKVAEMEVLKGQLRELNILREKVAELERVKAQLGELERLKQEVNQMHLVKQQFSELHNLRAKVAELNSVKSKLGELNSLKSQANQISVLKNQLTELMEMKTNNTDYEELQKKILDLERSRLEYEYELKKLKDDQSRSQLLQDMKKEKNIIEFSKTGSSKVKSGGIESKQLLFEDKAEQICVKGEIIHNAEELELLTRKINKLNQRITLNLLYKATADSDKAAAFHEKCDDARCTLVLVETDKGRRFGGYTTCSWSGDCIDKKDEEAFVFSLDKMNIYENIPGEDAIGCYPKFGPIFLGCQIRIYDNAFTKGGTTYEKGLNYNTEEDYELTGGDREFNVKEIEVYEVICH